MKKFLLIDDHAVIRSAINALLSQAYYGAQIDEASDGDNALAKIKETVYDLIILDIQLPETDTLGLMEYLKTKYSGINVLIFSVGPEVVYANRYLKAGARGFINKNAPLDEIKSAVNKMLNNQIYISPLLANTLKDHGNINNDNLFNVLSVREFEIVSLLLNGQTISKIAQTLNLSVSTVGTHKGRVFNKLHVTNLLELKELASLYNL